MLFPDTIIQWMDVKSGQVTADTVSSLFQTYSYKAVKDYHNMMIDFNNSEDDIKITDMYGWTKIMSITKTSSISNWVECILEGTTLTITTDTIVPIYDPDNPVKGFHGETKYPITFKSILDTSFDDMMRLKTLGTCTTNENEFRNVYYNHKNHIADAYFIITKSNFYNANNVHLTSV